MKRAAGREGGVHGAAARCSEGFNQTLHTHPHTQLQALRSKPRWRKTDRDETAEREGSQCQKQAQIRRGDLNPHKFHTPKTLVCTQNTLSNIVC